MKILICSIMRDAMPVIQRYFQRLDAIVDTFPEHEFYLSIYENDSSDETPLVLLKGLNLVRFKDYNISCEKIGTPRYTSFQNGEINRLKNLATARNKAIVGKKLYLDVDKILWIEPDVDFDTDYIKGLLDFPEPDIYSGVNLYRMKPHETVPPNRIVLDGRVVLCDTWATRRDENEEYGDLFPDHETNPIRRVYSTFNAVCMYNAEGFRRGARFDHVNPAFTHHDCDTAVVCLNFRKVGLDEFYINQNLRCYHDPHN